MANLCNFEMKIVGERKNIESFIGAMQQAGDVFMGRGAQLDTIDYYDEDGYAKVIGVCKWSLEAALTLNAIDMRENPRNWGDFKKDKDGNFVLFHFDEIDVTFVTLEEACKKFDVTIEAFSSEPGCCIAEHYIVTPEGTKVHHFSDYFEYYLNDYRDMTKEEAERKIGAPISDEAWEDPDGCITIGGFRADYSI